VLSASVLNSFRIDVSPDYVDRFPFFPQQSDSVACATSAIEDALPFHILGGKPVTVEMKIPPLRVKDPKRSVHAL
jgi:hypothetical protein